MQLTRTAVKVFVLALVPSLAGAQDIYGDVEAPPDGKVTDIRHEKGRRVNWMSTYEGVPLYKDAACTQERGTASYTEEFFELWRDPEVVLLAKSTDKKSGKATSVSGYARQADLLASRSYAYMCLKTPSGVERKALVVHQWRGGTEGLKEAPLLNAPRPDAKQLGVLRLYEILYIQAFHPAPGQDSSAQPDPDGYCLVSSSPYCVSEGEEIDKFRGWLPNNRVFVWDHREAVEFNKDGEALSWRAAEQKPIEIFGNLDDAQSGQEFEFREDTATGQWPHYQQRFPIIDRHVGEDEIEYLEIGVIGDSYSGERKLTAGREALIQQQIETLKQGIRELDVLIVIDATGSMGKFFASIGETVEKIQNAIGATSVNSVKYGALFYRDYTEEQNPDSWIHFYLQLRNPEEFRKEVSEMKSAGGADNPPTFYGLHTALNLITWRKNSTRMVVLIGDMGNEVPDKRNYDLDMVVEELEKWNCSFFAIQTQPGTNDDRAHRFDSQAMEIAKRLNMPFQEVLTPVRTDLSQALTKNFSIASTEVAVLEAILQNMRQGGSVDDATEEVLRKYGIDEDGGTVVGGNPNESPWGVFIGDRVLKRADEVGIDTDLLLNSRIQKFAFGHCAVQRPGEPYPQLKTRVFMSKADLGTVVNAFERLRHETLTNQNVDLMWRAIVNALLGERESALEFDENLPISQYLSKALELPARGDYLNMSVRKLKTLDPSQLVEMRDEILAKTDLLNNFLHNKRPDGSGTQNNSFIVNEVEFFWVPIEYFP